MASASNYKAVCCGFCDVLAFDLRVRPVANVFSNQLFLCLQLYHVIWMNLHRDLPMRRRRGFRKCLKTTQQQQSFLSMGTPLGQSIKVRFWCLSLTVG